jgi:hypothetical protein
MAESEPLEPLCAIVHGRNLGQVGPTDVLRSLQIGEARWLGDLNVKSVRGNTGYFRDRRFSIRRIDGRYMVRRLPDGPPHSRQKYPRLPKVGA